jgi:hypothetical protein
MSRTHGLRSGFVAFLSELAGRGSDDSHLKLRISVPLLVAVTGLVGVLRLALEVALGVRFHPKWYTFDPDIVFTMFFFPPSLLFFGTAVLHVMIRFVAGRDVDLRRLVSVFAYTQVLHLVVPVADALGFALGMPSYYNLGSGYALNQWYTLLLAFTPGIIVAWALTLYIAAKVLLLRFSLGISSVLVILILTIPWLIVPIYIVWPTFNTLSNRLLGISARVEFLYWGYGAYFALTTFLGALYYHVVARSKV